MENWEKYRPEKFEFVGGWVRNWFSNMAPSVVIIDGLSWPSTENYYQAMKTEDISVQLSIREVAPNVSKRLGRLVVIRPDWEQIKYKVMKTALRAKFSLPIWKEKLLATKDETLIEWNNWNDKTWGVSIKDNLGQNLLGKALMEIREELKV